MFLNMKFRWKSGSFYHENTDHLFHMFHFSPISVYSVSSSSFDINQDVLLYLGDKSKNQKSMTNTKESPPIRIFRKYVINEDMFRMEF